MTGVAVPNIFASFRPESGSVLRFVQSYTWVASQRQVIDIPRGNDIMSLIVMITGDFTLSSAATTVSAVAPAQLISRMTWRGDSTKQMEDTTGILAAWGNFERSLSRDIVAPGVGAATHTVRAMFRLDRATPDGPRPKDSALHTNQQYMGSQQLFIDAGTIAACYSNFGTGVVSATNLQVSVYSEELQEGSPMGMSEERMLRKHTLYQNVFTATNANYLQPLLPNTYMRGVKILALLTSTGEPTAGGVTNVRIRSGNNIRLDITEAALRAKNLGSFDLQSTQLSAVPGLMFADLVEAHKLNTLWNLWNASDVNLELAVTTGYTVYMQLIDYDVQPAIPIPQRVAQQVAQGAVRSTLRGIGNRAIQAWRGGARPATAKR